MTSPAAHPDSSANGAHLRIAPDQCYWGVLDVSVLPRRHRSDPQRLGYLLEAQLPCPIEPLQAVFINMTPNEVIGCAMERDRLKSLIHDRGSEVISLTPRSAPAFMGDLPESLPARLNLLTGSFEPPRVRRLRRNWALQTLCLVAAIGALLVLGLERRRIAVQNKLESVRTRAGQLIEDTLSAAAGPTSLPPEQRLVSELRRLEQTRSMSADSSAGSEMTDLTDTLFDLLAAWPARLHARTELVSITPEAITVRGFLTNNGDAQTLADALDVVEEWSVRQPQVNATGDGVQVVLTMVPAASPEDR